MAIKFKITNGTYTAEGTSATIKCNGKKLASDIVIEAVEVALISFTITGATYQAVEGMTWKEWCDSEYNTDGYYINDGVYNGTSCICTSQLLKDYVDYNDYITANNVYYLVETGEVLP